MEKSIEDKLNFILAFSHEKACETDYSPIDGLNFRACKLDGLASIQLFGRSFFLDTYAIGNPKVHAKIDMIYKLLDAKDQDVVSEPTPLTDGEAIYQNLFETAQRQGRLLSDVWDKLKVSEAKNATLLIALESIKERAANEPVIYGLANTAIRNNENGGTNV